jgi:hypothetical protein
MSRPGPQRVFFYFLWCILKKKKTTSAGWRKSGSLLGKTRLSLVKKAGNYVELGTVDRWVCTGQFSWNQLKGVRYVPIHRTVPLTVTKNIPTHYYRQWQEVNQPTTTTVTGSIPIHSEGKYVQQVVLTVAGVYQPLVIGTGSILIN